MTEKTSIKEKLAAMGRIVRILDKLDGVTAERVVDWLHEQYEHPTETTAPDQTS